MRRLVIIIIVLLVAAALWQLDKLGFLSVGGGFGTGSNRGASATPGRQQEFRIEIVETADQSEARYREILARYGDNPAAREWVAACMADAEVEQAEVSQSWEYACWRSWADEFTDEASGPSRR